MKIDSSRNQPSKLSWTDVLTMNDPDLECPEHDKMSIALADPEFTLELLRATAEGAGSKKRILSTSVQLEYPVTSGSGAWKKIVGFLDALCQSFVEEDGFEVVLTRDPTTGNTTKTNGDPVCMFNPRSLQAIEAKPVVSNSMQVLRQLKTYREFLPSRTIFILWCPTLSPSVNHVFSSQGVFVCNLSIQQIQARIKTE